VFYGGTWGADGYFGIAENERWASDTSTMYMNYMSSMWPENIDYYWDWDSYYAILNGDFGKPVQMADLLLNYFKSPESVADSKHVVLITYADFRNDSSTLSYLDMVDHFKAAGVSLSAIVPQNLFGAYSAIEGTGGGIFDLAQNGAGIYDYILNSAQ
jgi:hypothetical protein